MYDYVSNVTIQDNREWLARQRPIVFYTAGFLFHGDIFIPELRFFLD